MKLRNGYKIVFAGDSTTDADKRSTQDLLGNGYVRLIRNALTAFHPEMETFIVNSGISGNKSSDLLARWDADVSAHNPDIVFCMIGINDVWRHFDYLEDSSRWLSEDDYRANLKKMVEKSKGFYELVLLTPYYMESNRSDEMRLMTDRYSEIVRKTGAECKLHVIDTQARFDKYMKSRPGQSISWDRVHPGAVGSVLLADEILKFLES